MLGAAGRGVRGLGGPCGVEGAPLPSLTLAGAGYPMSNIIAKATCPSLVASDEINFI